MNMRNNFFAGKGSRSNKKQRSASARLDACSPAFLLGCSVLQLAGDLEKLAEEDSPDPQDKNNIPSKETHQSTTSLFDELPSYPHPSADFEEHRYEEAGLDDPSQPRQVAPEDGETVMLRFRAARLENGRYQSTVSMSHFFLSKLLTGALRKSLYTFLWRTEINTVTS
jgi:hypothetical protein